MFRQTLTRIFKGIFTKQQASQKVQRVPKADQLLNPKQEHIPEIAIAPNPSKRLGNSKPKQQHSPRASG